MIGGNSRSSLNSFASLKITPLNLTRCVPDCHFPPNVSSFSIEAILGPGSFTDQQQVSSRLPLSCYSSGEKNSNNKSKRVRTIFRQDQIEHLERAFNMGQYMVGSERLLLAKSLSLTESQVKVWFQNRRIKWRKQQLEEQAMKLSALRLKQESRYYIIEEEDSETSAIRVH